MVFLLGFPLCVCVRVFFRIFIFVDFFLAKGEKSPEVKADIDGKIQSSVS